MNRAGPRAAPVAVAGSSTEVSIPIGGGGDLCVVVATLPNARVILDGVEQAAIPETVGEGETPAVGYARFDGPRPAAVLVQAFDGETQIGPDMTIDLGAF